MNADLVTGVGGMQFWLLVGMNADLVAGGCNFLPTYSVEKT